mgnify:CR=1 FL=1
MFKKIIFYKFFFFFGLFGLAQSAEETGGMPQLNPEFWVSQIVWLVITFLCLYIILSKVILPKISDNLESRRSQILENIEIAEKQREESENKLKEFEKIIIESKLEAKNIFNDARQKIIAEIDKKRVSLEQEIENAIKSTEEEIIELKNSSDEKVTKIAFDTSSDLIKQLIGVEINNDSILSVVKGLSNKNKENTNVI